MSNHHSPITILGAGYVGQALRRQLPDAEATHRQPSPEPLTHAFQLEDAATWPHVPLAGRTVVWTFPAQPLEQVQGLYEAHLKDAAGLIVLGSTSAYQVPEAAANTVVTVDETTPLDLTRPRVQGEEWLRQQGATVLQLAGIFGPDREPADWLRRGRIKDGAKIVNLIHVDDTVALIIHLLAHPLPGKRINVSNGKPIVWRELAAQFQREGKIPGDLVLSESIPGQWGKRIDNGELRRLLPHFRFIQP